jgi:2-polyprenyl-3-methyl-5-hydroxy-6-metoxy-1,4-benzoquinol methylase
VNQAGPACPLCGAACSLAFATSDFNRRATERAFRYYDCHRCGVIFLENAPSDLPRYYTSGYHHTPDASRLDEASGPEAYKLDFVRPRVPSGSLVDIGPSYGAFPHVARRAGYDVTAIEMDAECCTFIEQVIGVRTMHSSEPQTALMSLPQVDVITLWHSIEHLPEPWLTLQAAAARLRPGGLLVVSTPNPVGFQARLLKGRWVHVDAPRHLFLIPPTALVNRALACGFAWVLTASADEETLRCNRLGWQRALFELGLRHAGDSLGAPTAQVLGTAMERIVRPFESRGNRASAYVAVFAKG